MSLAVLKGRLDVLEQIISLDGSSDWKSSIGTQLINDVSTFKRVLAVDNSLTSVIQRYQALQPLIEDPTSIDTLLEHMNHTELALEAAAPEYLSLQQPLMQIESLSSILDQQLPTGR